MIVWLFFFYTLKETRELHKIKLCIFDGILMSRSFSNQELHHFLTYEVVPLI